jgi:hypothetical protein
MPATKNLMTRRIFMKMKVKTLAASLGAFAVALLLVPNAAALCGTVRQPVKSPASWRYQLGQARVLEAGYANEDLLGGGAGIVGFWHVKFVSKGSAGIPDGAEVDAGYAQWHSDGTEIMNSGGRSPLTGDFCLGVWKQVGARSYKLNHFAAAWDATGSNLVGPAQIQEQVTLDHDGDQFAGSFTIDQYTEAGNLVAHVQGVITGTRITVTTPSQSVF